MSFLLGATIFVGGGLGAFLRYALNSGTSRWLGNDWPYGILLINSLGGLCMGLLNGGKIFALNWSPEFRAFLSIGVLGGFTTFSSYTLDVVHLWQRGEEAYAIAYIVLSNGLAIVGLILGLWLMRVSG